LAKLISKIQRPRRALTVFAVETLLLGGAAALLVPILAATTPAIKDAFALATTKKPEAFTELYFNDSAHLPTSAPVGQPRTFSFHIHSHEAHPVVYRYEVRLSTPDSTSMVAQGSVVLTPGAGADIPVTFTTTEEGVRPQITVHLLGREEVINFRSES
jgi:hypothetical protein